MKTERQLQQYDGAGLHMYRTWDWYDMYIKDWMPQQNHNLSVTGGNGRTNYGITLGYLTQEGLTKDNPDTYDRYNANLTLKYGYQQVSFYQSKRDVYPYRYGKTIFICL